MSIYANLDFEVLVDMPLVGCGLWAMRVGSLGIVRLFPSWSTM